MSRLTAAEFLAQVDDLAPAIEALRLGEYSDVLDAEGHQYVDIVMEGGGTLGLALLGYLHVLESVGLRFIGIGGTSAGAISAIALAAANRPGEPRVGSLIEAIGNMPMADFVDGRQDGDDDATSALQSWLDDNSHTVSKLWRTSRILDNLNDIHALNRGEVFHRWMDELLRSMNGGQALTVQQLRVRMNDLPVLLVSENADASDFRHLPNAPIWELVNGKRVYLPRSKPDQLCVVTADISTETKVSLPQMAAMYWRQPDQVNVADFARASMSIPGFFATFKVNSLPADEARPLWRSQEWPERCYEGDFLPAVHHFVDGGVLSNFPIDAFHQRTRVPLRPTLGVKLQWDEHKHDIPGVLKVFSQSFNTARHAMDAEFIKQNPDYSKLVAYIDTEEINWLDFAMDKPTKLRLFRMGAQTAVAFLRGFNWRDYKRIRRSLAEAYSLRV